MIQVMGIKPDWSCSGKCKWLVHVMVIVLEEPGKNFSRQPLPSQGPACLDQSSAKPCITPADSAINAWNMLMVPMDQKHKHGSLQGQVAVNEQCNRNVTIDSLHRQDSDSYYQALHSRYV
jgi:hypothetical protein